MKKAFLVSVASLLLMGVCSCSTVENVKEPTEYALKEDCFLCGDRGLLSLYQDGVAVLNLNTFEVRLRWKKEVAIQTVSIVMEKTGLQWK